MPKARTATAAAPSDVAPAPAEYLRVPLAAIAESPLNPRRSIDEAGLADLVASIRQHGIIEPIVLRAGEIGFEVVAGARRTRAARLAGLADVPAMIRYVTDAELLELALQENIHRASMTALEEARALVKLAEIDPAYRDDRVLAGVIGRSETYVRDRRKLLTLDPIVQAALEGGALTPKHAERIARLPRDQHRQALEACFAPLVLVAEVLASDETGTNPPTVAERIEASDWAGLAPALQGLRSFDAWAEENAKVNLAAPEVQQQLVEALRDDADVQAAVDTDGDDLDAVVAAATLDMVQLSTVTLDRKQAAALGVLALDMWKPVGDSLCPYVQRGVIVHGDDDDGRPRTAPELVTVCTAKRQCNTHWPKQLQRTSSGTSGGYDWQAEEEKRRAEREAWEAELPRYGAAVAACTTKLTLTPALVRFIADSFNIEFVEKVFGVPLTPKTVVQVLALTAVRTNDRKYLLEDAKALGVTAKQLTAAVKAAAKGATPAKAERRSLNTGKRILKKKPPSGSSRAPKAKKKGGRS